MKTVGETRLVESASTSGGMASKDLSSMLDRARQGEADAYKEIYNEYVSRIYTYVFRMVNSREDTEDLTQEIFFLAYINLKDLRDNANFEPWLYRIARNQVFKGKRRNKVRSEPLDDQEKGIYQILKNRGSNSNPEEKLLSGELGKRLQIVVESLPINYRETLILATIHGLNYKDISNILGRSLSSVKTDVYRARLIIADRMGKYLTTKSK